MEKQNYAIIIPLIGQIGKVAFQMWDDLDKEFNINYLKKRSPAPHLTLTAGQSLTEVNVMLDRLKLFIANQRPFTIESNGLGMLMLASPLIYIRWHFSNELNNLYTSVSSYFKESIDVLGSSVEQKTWIPKTTIAFKDITYEDLPKIIGKLHSYDLKQQMRFCQLALWTYGPEGEKVVETLSIES